MVNEEPEEYLNRLVESGVPPERVLAEADRILASAEPDLNFARALSDLGIYASESGLYPAAIRYFEAALDLRPDNPKNHYDLAVALMGAQLHKDARAPLEKAISMLPLYTYALGNLATVYFFLGDFVGAAFAMDRVIELFADQPYPESLTRLREAVTIWTLSPHFSARLFRDAMARWGTQDFEDGARAFAELAAALPDDCAGRVIAEEHVALAAFVRDRHSEYLAGSARRRALVPCVQALTPRYGIIVVGAATSKDGDAFCHRMIKMVNPAYDAEGSILLHLSRSKDGDGIWSREFSISTSDGIYKLVPIGNTIRIKDPMGETHEITDYSGDHASLYNIDF